MMRLQKFYFLRPNNRALDKKLQVQETICTQNAAPTGARQILDPDAAKDFSYYIAEKIDYCLRAWIRLLYKVICASIICSMPNNLARCCPLALTSS